MASIALERSDVIVGVDTHKDQHVAVALDGLGGSLDDRVIVAANGGYAELLAWALGLGRVVAFGVEGCGSYGIGLARLLRRHGHQVMVEVSRPPRNGNDVVRARAISPPPATLPARCWPGTPRPLRRLPAGVSSRSDWSRSCETRP